MQPVYGTWETDLAATLHENEALAPQMLAAIREDLGKSPFTLTISKTQYISRSGLKTMTDDYRFVSSTNGRLTIELLGKGGAPAAPEVQRTAVLSLRNDHLLIRGSGFRNLIISMKRTEAAPEAKPPEAPK